MTQLDSSIISALRRVLDELCGHLPVTCTAARALVASSILECAHDGEQTHDDLKQAGIEALKRDVALVAAFLLLQQLGTRGVIVLTIKRSQQLKEFIREKIR
jgi:uncharacterized protein with NRDE domain